jgi:GTP-binding protein Era
MLSARCEMEVKVKSGFISIIGRPNVGKSTILNAILGEKIAITSNKPQTTRNRIRGILSEKGDDGDLQLIFIDTPGIARPRNKLGAYMADQALSTFDEVDMIMFVADEPLGKRGGDNFILERLKEARTPAVLVINKMDLMSPDEYKEVFESYDQTGAFKTIIGISALKGQNIDVLLQTLRACAEEGPMYFPFGIVTDMPERFLACEIIREKMLHYLREEIPHGVAVEIESYEEKPNLTKISAVILTERKAHKGIIIGKDGHTLKGIGKSARTEIESLLGVKVFLELWVKVREKWRDDKSTLSSLGYTKD